MSSDVTYQESVGDPARRVARDSTAEATPAADPAPLGLAGFALTTALLSGVNAHLIVTGALTFIGMAIAYGGLAQLLAGMWEFRNRNTFGATAFSSFGAFWIGVGLLFIFDTVGKATPAYFAGDGAIWFFFCWAVFTTYMFVASLKTTGAVAAVFVLLAATFWALWAGAVAGNAFGHGWTNVGGYLGFATAIVAGYTSFAGVANSTFGRVVLPVMPMASKGT
jgi:uncharacterized protein